MVCSHFESLILKGQEMWDTLSRTQISWKIEKMEHHQSYQCGIWNFTFYPQYIWKHIVTLSKPLLLWWPSETIGSRQTGTNLCEINRSMSHRQDARDNCLYCNKYIVTRNWVEMWQLIQSLTITTHISRRQMVREQWLWKKTKTKLLQVILTVIILLVFNAYKSCFECSTSTRSKCDDQ